MIHPNSSPTSVPGESAGFQVGDIFSPLAAANGPQSLKPFTSTHEQIALLRRRGLDVQQEPQAHAVLRRVGYYRLSGYAHSLKQSGSSGNAAADAFHVGASFDQIVGIADFDAALRLLLLDGLGTIELAVRAALVERLGPIDVEAHRNPKLFDRRFTSLDASTGTSPHDEWLKRFDALCAKSKEDFVEHHRRRYGGRMPIWAAVEILELGLLSRLVEGLQFRDAKAMSQRFGVGHPIVLRSWMHMFNVARNRAAHHVRIWNRATTKIPLLPTKEARPDLEFLHEDEHAKTRLFGTLSCMRSMIQAISPQDAWHRQIKALIATFPKAHGLSLRAAGFPSGWETLQLWAD